MKTITRWVLGLALLAVAAAAGWYWVEGRKSDPRPTPTHTVTVAQVGEFFIYMPLYYAEERGYFDKHGLDVRFVASGGDEKSVAAVVAGSADFGVGDPTFAAVAKSQGQDVRVIAAVVGRVPFWGVTKKADVPVIERPADLRGYTVATFPRPSTAYALQSRMFREGGLEPDIREAQFGSLLPLLETGAVDIVLELEPNVSIAVDQGGRVVYSLADRYADFAVTGVTVSGQTIRSRPDLVRRFVAALDEAERAAHANPDDVVAFAKARFPSVKPEIAEAAIRRMLSSQAFPRTSDVSATGWDNAIELRVGAGDLQDAGQAADVVDRSFAPK